MASIACTTGRGVPPSSAVSASGQLTSSPASVSSRQSTQLQTVKIAVPGRGVAYLPLVVAQQRGFLEQRGFIADIRPLREDVAIAALASDEVDAITSTWAGIKAAINGIPAKVVMVMTGRPQHTIMSVRPLGSLAELRGRSLVADVRGGILDTMARLALQQAGVDPADVSFLYAGTPDARLGMLLQHLVDAGTMDLVSTVKARELGYHEVVDLGKVIQLPLNGLVVTDATRKERAQQIRELIAGILDGTRFLRENRATTIKIISDWSEVDEGMATALYDLAVNSYTLNGRIDDDVLRRTVEAQSGYQPDTLNDLSQFVDFSLLPIQ
jgi:ABC-type nitrate/sulfonate/bicarbonate transport system substrate-binding protein